MATCEVWNSLEIAKLVTSTLTPLVVVVVGYWIRRAVMKIEHRQWSNKSVIEWRIRVFDGLAPILNNIYCFGVYKGGWKDLEPPDIIALKREADIKAYLAAPLFSKTFMECYSLFMDACYKTYTGKGKDALLRANVEMHRNARPEKWNPDWNDMFVNVEERTRRKETEYAYTQLMAAFSENIGLGLHTSQRRRPNK